MPITERTFSCGRVILHAAFACILHSAIAPLLAQSTQYDSVPTVSITPISETVTLDGISNETFWQSIAPLPLTMREPSHRAPLTERTEIRIVHDASYLYLSGRFYDSDPSGIRVNSMYRDRSRGNDIFGILINPYDDNDIGLAF